jgi:DNA invertase Pin-like site-specific DNA recombinase
MRYFYARVSSKDQNLDRQLELARDCDKIFTDKESGKDFERKGYNEMMRVLESGDTVVVKSLDRFGRNYELIVDEWRRLRSLGVRIEVLDMPILNSKSDDLTDRLISDIVLQLLSYVAESERVNTKQRQKEGIRIAKEKGIKFGRPKSEVTDCKTDSETVSEYCARVGISRATYYRLNS